MELIATVAILGVVSVALLLALGAVWWRGAQQIVEAQEDAAAAVQRADDAEEDLERLQDRLDVALDDLDEETGAADQYRAWWLVAEAARRQAIVAARLALTFYGREHDVAVQAAEAWQQQAETLERIRDAHGALQDEVEELRAAADVAVDERATLREQVRAAKAVRA